MEIHGFIDTSFLFALFVERDQNHASAMRYWNRSIAARNMHVTSNLVISELGTLLAYRCGHQIACRQIELILHSNLIKIAYSDRPIEHRALGWWSRFADQKFSYVDCVSFEFMETLGLKKALSFDKDFAVAGFQIVRFR